jgi:hypothetical protein
MNYLRWAVAGWRYASIWAPTAAVLCEVLRQQPRGKLTPDQRQTVIDSFADAVSKTFVLADTAD